MRFIFPERYPLILYMLTPSRAAMADSVSPDRTTYVRRVTVVPLLPWRHALSPGYTIDGFPLGTATFHQSLQNILTYCPLWMTTQLAAGVLGCGLGVGVGLGLPELVGRLPAYAYHVFRSPYTTLRSRGPRQFFRYPVPVYCHATANGQCRSVGCLFGGLNP